MLAMARAKINLFLAVGEKRPDGFHDIDSVITAIDRADILDIAAGAKPRLDVQLEDLPAGQDVAKGSDNLVWKAAERVLGPDRGWRVTLYKTIPVGAGLGGGSSDAALALQALTALYKLEVPDLAAKAADVGSDVPFFLQGGLCRVRGRGERVEALAVLPTLHVVVAVPPVEVSTAEAYAWIDASPDRPRRDISEFLASLGSGDPRAIARAVWNDFEAPVMNRHPEIASAKAKLLGHGAWGAALCGSGSAVFGIFATPDEANQVAFTLRRDGLWAIYAPTAPRSNEFGRDPAESPELIG
ncbi:MAG: 4-(cytidine 5'-diphospho)-2-C-methyl-D-erythritol kinase [Candidatus Sericytochromatia bacterium]|uniref:4-diphosphocytidyl-2-C-methyl-D-erythritol kinase n=1 Tax=Candidatus Tanganyikabacteria bacterium TaxID=2961651 RepID=A0A937X3F6_9BACT|nr:4-(cytidine 5'-diphospho)-2-C-methyl-D-erythritol kinase [Candidatus Tanganyikabacteria bacterium]